jgi:pimeloyl-ACP methyl ester carboxylesterase
MVNSMPTPVQRRRRGVDRLLRGIALTIVGLLILLAIVGASYQAIETRVDARRFPQIGRSVDVGGYRLNINCNGQGSPTVILESALGVPAVGWQSVQPEIAKFAHVCSYDRAGYGWSDPGPQPRTSMQIARELHLLLLDSDEPPPYVLVGHSFGGADVRAFSSLYPNEVVGMVLAETGLENLKFPASIQKLIDKNQEQRERENSLARVRFWFGISRFAIRKQIGIPAVAYDDQRDAYFGIQPKFIEATTSEVRSSKEDAEELKALESLGDKPLIVLSAGKNMLGMPLNTKDWHDLHDVWVNDVQMRLVHLSSRGKQIMVPDSGHMIPFERPEAIVNAVREVCAVVR